MVVFVEVLHTKPIVWHNFECLNEDQNIDIDEKEYLYRIFLLSIYRWCYSSMICPCCVLCRCVYLNILWRINSLVINVSLDVPFSMSSDACEVQSLWSVLYTIWCSWMSVCYHSRLWPLSHAYIMHWEGKCRLRYLNTQFAQRRSLSILLHQMEVFI